MRRILPAGRLGPVALLGLLPVLAYWPLVVGGKVIYWGTPLLQFYPWRQLAREAYLSGRVPLWNPYLGGGAPLAANLQSAVFYPLNGLFLLLPVEVALGYSLVLHVALAGLFTYAFARRLGLAREGALLAGMAYMFGGPFAARAGFLSMAAAGAWLPMLLWAVEGLLRGERRLLDRVPAIAWLAAGVALPLLAGHAQLWYYFLWAALLYALYRGLTIRAPFLSWMGLALGVVLGLGLAAIQLLPTVELASLSVRAGGAETEFAMAYSLWPWQLVGLLAPDFFGHPAHGDYWGPGAYWEAAAYGGTIPLLLAIAGLLRRRLGGGGASPYPFFVLLAALALLLAVGHYLPFYPYLFRHVPGFGLFQAPARFLYLYSLAAALLAGWGMETWLGGSAGRERQWASRVLFASGLGLLVAVVTLWLLMERSGVRLSFVSALLRPGAMLALAGAILVATPRLEKARRRSLVSYLLLGLVAVDLITFAAPLQPTTDSQVYRANDLPTLAFLRAESGADRFRIYTPQREFTDRFFGYFDLRSFGSRDAGPWLAVRNGLLPDTAAAAGVAEFYNYDPLQLGRMAQLGAAIDASGLNQRLLNVANIRYVISDRAEASSGLVLALAGNPPLYENPQPLSRAYVVFDARWASTPGEALNLLRGPGFDPARQVILEGTPALGGEKRDQETAEPRPVAEIVRYEPETVTVRARLPRPGYLVLSDAYYPGWRAQVNGNPATIRVANFAWRAVELPAGDHEVEFRYEAPTFRGGAAISGATLLVLGAALLLSRWKT